MKKIVYVILSSLLVANASFANVQPPSGFIENKGQIVDDKKQVRSDIHFKVEQPGLNAYFKPDGIIYHVYRSEEKSKGDYTQENLENFKKGDMAAIGKKVYFFRMDFELLNSNKEAEVIKTGKHSIKRNYYLANCPRGILDVEEYGEIVYVDVYPNIDLRYYYKDELLKYEFIVHPGGDPSQIRFRYNGSTNTRVENDQLVVENIYNNLSEAKPYTYIKNGQTEVSNSFVVNNGIVSFHPGEYDPSATLIIDPTITWASYYNNNYSSDFHCNSAFDSNGKIYSAFATYGSTWPTINAGGGQYYDAVKDGITDLIVLGFNADYSVQWVTYYGGSDGDYLCGTGGDYGKTIGVDQNNNVYVAGYAGNGGGLFPTMSSIFPGCFYQDQTHLYGGDNPFLVKFNSNGVRQWATIYNHEQPNTNSAGLRINGICVSGTKIYFTGQTYRFNSNDIPLRNLAGAYNQTTFLGAQDCFLGRFNDNCVLEWSTYFNSGTVGQTAYKDGADVYVDASGNLLLAGHVSSGGSNTSAYLLNPGGGAYYQSAVTGSIDVYLAKFNTSMQPVWATYYGGNDLDRVSQISADASGNILVACRTINSNTFPVLNPGGGAYYQGTKPSPGTNSDGALMKFNSSGVRIWATYVGGTNNTNNSTTGIAADGSGNIYAIGYTNTSNFSVLNDGSFYQGTTGGGSDLFFMKFNSSEVLQSSTYYGNTGDESCYGVKMATTSNGCSFNQFNFFTTNSASLTTVNPGGSALYQTSPTTANANACILMSTLSGTLSSAPTSINSSPTVSCSPGFTTTLTVSGGSLGTGANWYWYSGSCGGSAVGTGTSVNVSPTVATTYYVRAEGTCNTTTCTSLTVTPPMQVTANMGSSTNTSCFGINDGSATVTPGGGTGSYTYSWSPSGGSAATASGLGAATYTVTVSDGNLCSATATVTISSPTQVTANITSSNNVSCFNGSNGDATVTPGGGTGSYTYAWAPSGGVAATATGLSNNTYTVTVTDGNSCSATSTVTISQPPIINATVDSHTDPLCFGDANGTANASATGGTGTLSYLWAPSGGSAAMGTGMSDGTYTVTVTDANLCTQTSTVTLVQPVAVNCGANVVSNPNPPNADGSMAAIASGGVGGYTFSWSPSGGNSQLAVGLSAGITYTVTVTDLNGCTCTSTLDFGNVSVEENAEISFNLYPNPGSDYFQIKVSGEFSVFSVIKVYDLSGKVLINKPVIGEFIYMDMDSFASGVYLVNLISGENVITRKWVKK